MAENDTRPAPCHTERVVDGTTVVELRGDIDILTATRLSVRLDALTAGARTDLVLDLRPVTFIDCSGLRLLCRTRNHVLARHGRLRLVCDSGRLLHILRPVGLAGVFELLPDLPTALFEHSGAERRNAVPVAAGRAG
ncbi:STAS domain-containing protein [Streptomyces sp. CA-249302]|uniref:STAS domain-containing protein n=1 Tax=Streptomyces sp. CA-249302 TaxID=3240058 RepID=UPI003D8B2C88